MEVARLLISRVVLSAMAALVLCDQFASARTPGAVKSSDVTPTRDEKPAANSSPLGWIKMPTVTMPRLTMPTVTMPKMPADPMAPFRTSAKKVGDGATKAWEGTKELFTFGGSKNVQKPAPRVASKGEPPTMMQRLFGAKEEPVDEGPRTIGEWMSQPRVDR